MNLKRQEEVLNAINLFVANLQSHKLEYALKYLKFQGNINSCNVDVVIY